MSWRDLSPDYERVAADGHNPLYPAYVKAWNNTQASVRYRQSMMDDGLWNPNALPEGRCGIIASHDPHEVQTRLNGAKKSELVWCRGHDDDR